MGRLEYLERPEQVEFGQNVTTSQPKPTTKKNPSKGIKAL